MPVVSFGAFEQSELELKARLARLECRLIVMRSLLFLLLALVRVRGARLTDDKLPRGNDRARILSALERAMKSMASRMARC